MGNPDRNCPLISLIMRFFLPARNTRTYKNERHKKDSKLVTYADVALNGNKHILQDYSPEIDKTLTIYCFQPASGYCACVLIPS